MASASDAGSGDVAKLILMQGMYLFTAVAIALMGAGRLSLGGVGGRWN